MARQDDACWRCGTQWASEDVPRPALRLIRGGAPDQARLDAERWIDEGGSFAAEAVAQPAGRAPEHPDRAVP